MFILRILYYISSVICKVSRELLTYGFNILKGIGNNLNNYTNVFRELKSKDILICHVDECHGTPFNLITKDKTTYEEFENLLIDNDLKLIYIYGGFVPPIRFTIKNIEFHNWPTFLLHLSHNDMIQKYGKPINQLNVNTNFNNLFICFNNVPKPHRAMMIDYLCKYNLLNKGIFSWNQLTNTHQTFEFKYWEEKITIIDDAHGTYTNHYGNVYTNDLLNYKSLFNLVGETFSHFDTPFITEKTFKCLLLGQPFVCYGTINQNTFLEKLGFKLYDEIFDYSFDSEFKIENRIEGIVKCLIEIVEKDYNEIYLQIKDKVEYNKKRALEIIDNDLFIPNKLIELYKTDKEKILSIERIPNFFDEIVKNRL